MPPSPRTGAEAGLRSGGGASGAVAAAGEGPLSRQSEVSETNSQHTLHAAGKGRRKREGGNKRVLLINTSVGNCVFCVLSRSRSLFLFLSRHLSQAQFDFLADKTTPRAFSPSSPLLVP